MKRTSLPLQRREFIGAVLLGLTASILGAGGLRPERDH